MKFNLRIENLTHIRLRNFDPEWYKATVIELDKTEHYLIQYELIEGIDIQVTVNDTYTLSKLVDDYELKFKNEFYV